MLQLSSRRTYPSGTKVKSKSHLSGRATRHTYYHASLRRTSFGFDWRIVRTNQEEHRRGTGDVAARPMELVTLCILSMLPRAWPKRNDMPPSTARLQANTAGLSEQDQCAERELPTTFLRTSATPIGRRTCFFDDCSSPRTHQGQSWLPFAHSWGCQAWQYHRGEPHHADHIQRG